MALKRREGARPPAFKLQHAGPVFHLANGHCHPLACPPESMPHDTMGTKPPCSSSGLREWSLSRRGSVGSTACLSQAQRTHSLHCNRLVSLSGGSMPTHDKMVIDGLASVRVCAPTLSRFSGVVSTVTLLVSIETPASTLDTGPRNPLSVFWVHNMCTTTRLSPPPPPTHGSSLVRSCSSLRTKLGRVTRGHCHGRLRQLVALIVSSRALHLGRMPHLLAPPAPRSRARLVPRP